MTLLRNRPAGTRSDYAARTSSEDIAICESQIAAWLRGTVFFDPFRQSSSNGISSFGSGGAAGSAFFSSFFGGIWAEGSPQKTAMAIAKKDLGPRQNVGTKGMLSKLAHHALD